MMILHKIVLRAIFFNKDLYLLFFYPVQFIMSLAYIQKNNCLSFHTHRTKAIALDEKHSICMVDAE